MNKHQQKWNKRYAASELVWSAQPNALFAGEVADLVPGKALDVGCGEGRNAIWLAEQGWEVTAIDFAQEGIAKGVRIADKKALTVNWIVSDIADMRQDQFNLVAVLYFHTDLEERQVWQPKIIDCVSSGGTFVYIGHDPSNIDGGVGGPQNAELLPSVDEITDHLNGFRIEHAQVVERNLDQESGHGTNLQSTNVESASVALDAFVRARRVS